MNSAARRIGREALLFSTLCATVLFGLSLVLISWHVQQLLTDLTQQRVLRLSQQVSLEADRGLRFGVGLPEQTAWLARLQQLDRQEPQLLGLQLQAMDGTLIAQAGDAQHAGAVRSAWHRQLAEAALTQPLVKQDSNRLHIGRTLADASGQASAQLWISIDLRSTQAQARAAGLRILGQLAPLLLLALALAWAALWRLGLQWQGAGHKRTTTALVLSATLVCAATPLAMVWSASDMARPLVARQIAANADAMARTLGQQIARAHALGIPLVQLQGVRALFDDALQRAPELGFVALRGAAGEELHATRQRGLASDADARAAQEQRLFPATPQGAQLVVGYPTDYVDRQTDGMLLDLALALVVSAVLLLECARGRWQRSTLAALVAQRLARRAARAAVRASLFRRRGAAAPGAAAPGAAAPGAAAFAPAAPDPATTAQLTRLRLVIFLIAMSEELLRPFLTVFAIDMPSPDPQPSPTLVANLAVAAFMATLALAQPAGPALAQRIDLRRGLVLSALAGSLALAATGAAQSAQALVLLRAFAGMAYGLALILAQTAMLRTTPPAQRARGMTQIVGAIVAAGIVGPPFGGMVAAQAGAPAGCAACALCLLLAAFFSQRLAPVPHTAGADQATGGWRGYAAVLRNPRALAVILGAGLPARLVAVMLLAVVVPLQMNALEQPAAVTGRALLLYFLVFAISAPWIAQWSDASGRRTPFLIAGGLVGALACWALPGLGGVPGMAIGCALLGLGQALQSSPQLALVTELFEPQPGRPQHASPEQALAAFRLLERLGSIAAPFATAWAVAALGYAGALWAIGLLLALATLAMLAALRPAADAVSFNPLPGSP
ncbi:MFS transporter [Comamonas endophytica]|uniref:MFS transporter n=1 Tax=Comamonas endophytica TaxID=2949090 RepID=A0ABY6GD50_9BURK|nr:MULTISPECIES: MFS transporter [unclassified Acidovorax]MCD2512859.1 MFS transporter [Acidovorax sp. D4N7]UYG52793.1 MFS transporter [Acidovorax sp. 5MLIR]